MLSNFTKDSLMDFLSNYVVLLEKKKIIIDLKELNEFETKFLERFSKKYNRFIAELPTIII